MGSVCFLNEVQNGCNTCDLDTRKRTVVLHGHRQHEEARAHVHKRDFFPNDTLAESWIRTKSAVAQPLVASLNAITLVHVHPPRRARPSRQRAGYNGGSYRRWPSGRTPWATRAQCGGRHGWYAPSYTTQPGYSKELRFDSEYTSMNTIQ